jgi:hypothetical protein
MELEIQSDLCGRITCCLYLYCTTQANQSQILSTIAARVPTIVRCVIDIPRLSVSCGHGTRYKALGQLIWSVIPIPIPSGVGQVLNNDEDLHLLQIKSFHSGLFRSAGSHRMKASTGYTIWAEMSRYRISPTVPR